MPHRKVIRTCSFYFQEEKQKKQKPNNKKQNRRGFLWPTLEANNLLLGTGLPAKSASTCRKQWQSRHKPTESEPRNLP